MNLIKTFCPASSNSFKEIVVLARTYVLPITKLNYCSRSISQTHYQTLNISKSCTSKEIREAFLRLSKQYHPDKNKGNRKAQEQFVKIYEAYNVLIKPNSRIEYDLMISKQNADTANKSYNVRNVNHHGYYRHPWQDPHVSKNKSYSEKNEQDYYGVKGIKKVSNNQIRKWLFVVISTVLVSQILYVRYFKYINYEAITRKNAENIQHLNNVKDRAEMLVTRERQIEAYKQRLNNYSQQEK